MSSWYVLSVTLRFDCYLCSVVRLGQILSASCFAVCYLLLCDS